MRQHLVLVGLSGAGKTTVGLLVARALGMPFHDLDQRIEASAGCRVAELFAREGEAVFRQREQREMLAVLAGVPAVVAAGGGWAAQPGNLAAAGESVRAVYLRVSAETAARRLAGSTDRPLLASGNLQERLSALLHAREPWYAKAECVVDAEVAPEEVAAQVVQMAMRRPGASRAPA